jgi:hypothetical protein
MDRLVKPRDSRNTHAKLRELKETVLKLIGKMAERSKAPVPS